MKIIERSLLARITGGEVGAIGSANGGGSDASYVGTTTNTSVACTNAQNTASAAAVAAGVACGTAFGPACVAGLIGLATATVNANNVCAPTPVSNPTSAAPATVATIATPAPEAESSGGDGGSPCVICTQLTRTGNMDISTWSAAQRYGNERFSAQVMNGYHAWGVPYVKLMRKSPMFAAIAKRPVNWFAEDLAYRMGVRAKPNYMGWALRELAFRPVCWSIGVFAKARDFQHLWTGRGAMA